MIDLLVDPKIWISLFSITLIQIALGADNLIIITIIANKLPASQRTKAVNLGLVLAMVFRIHLYRLSATSSNTSPGSFTNSTPITLHGLDCMLS